MRRTIVMLLCWAPAWAWSAAQPLEGRWEGRILIPDRDTPVVVDLARNGAGAWIGSIILPGLGIKGAPLENVVVARSEVAFDLGNLLVAPSAGPARFRARFRGADGLSGEMTQGGNIAKVSLRKIGPAQVEERPRSTPVEPALAAQWIGDFELSGNPRHVTLTLENHGDGPATATFVIVGRQTNNLPVSLVSAEGNFVRVESPTSHINFEGRLSGPRDELQGTLELGPLELPLLLRRGVRRTS